MPEIPDYKNHPEDKFYKWKGVPPPRRRSHQVVDTEDNPLSEQIREIASHKCSWKQRGYEVYCEEGPNRHGRRLKPGQKISPEGKVDKLAPILRSQRTKVISS